MYKQALTGVDLPSKGAPYSHSVSLSGKPILAPELLEGKVTVSLAGADQESILDFKIEVLPIPKTRLKLDMKSTLRDFIPRIPSLTVFTNFSHRYSTSPLLLNFMGVRNYECERILSFEGCSKGLKSAFSFRFLAKRRC